MTSKKSFALLLRKFFEDDPVKAAHALETLEETAAAETLESLPLPLAAETVRHLSEAYAAALLQKLPRALFKAVAEKLEPRKAAAIFLNLGEEARAQLLDSLEEERKKEVREFLSYPEASAGRIMSTSFLAFHADLRVKDAVQKIRQLAQRGASVSYVYVIDPEDRLVGVMNMRDMMLAPQDAALEAVMRRNVFTVDSFDDREKVAAEIAERKFFAVPVVDRERHLLGVVKAEQLIDDVQEEATEDFQKMFGAGGDERAFSPVGFALKKRLPWLHVNLATAFLAAWVVALFEEVIAKITILAVFLPVVAGQGGNAGAQSLAVVMRGLVMREIPPQKAKRLILKETLVGLANGIVIGSVTALAAWAWQGNPYLGLVIGLAMIVNLTLAGLSGAVIPVVMKAAGLDPAQCSSIILTTITDVMGFFSFLGFAVLFQKYLI
jgi:magnesium transporter